jgi:hypothetical protein
MFQTSDPRGYSITCEPDTWNDHIIIGHPIMYDNLAAVKETICNPDAIYISNQKPTRNVYFAKASTSTYNGLYTKVVVAVDDKTMTGSVISAWPQPAMTGGILDRGGVIYVKPKL